MNSPGRNDATSSGGHGKRQKLKELVRPMFQESYFTAEYCLLAAIQCNQPNTLSGLYVIPSAQNPFLWFGVLFVHNGPWQGGIFRFTLTFPPNFPDASQLKNLPEVTFTGAFPKFHPFIHPSKGTFELKRYYKSYSRSNNHVWQILKCLRKTFYKLDVSDKSSYPNKSACELYLKSNDEFLVRCEGDVQHSLSGVYEEDAFYNDANYIKFSKDVKPADPVLNIKSKVGIGLSWMNKNGE